MKSARRFLFRLSLIILPVILFLLLELFLRLLGVFAREPLFLPSHERGQKIIRLNSMVAKRYFDPKQVPVPTLYPQTFSAQKPSGTFRIFCLGGSTTAGFPFDYQVPFPAQLRMLLSQYYPQSRFEVINVGLSAVNSFTVLDFLPEILENEPDLIILYMGHNEFYGAYGSASTISIGRNATLIRFYLRLQKLHLVQMTRALISALSPTTLKDARHTTLMEKVIGQKTILYDSPLYRKTLYNFRENLELILNSCRKAGVPVFLSTLVCNIRNLPPMGSYEQEISDPRRQALRDSLITRTNGLLQQGHYETALPLALELFNSDSLSADNWFRLGQIYARSGDSIMAARYLTGAKDRDIVRFRASEEMNQIIRELADQYQITLTDIKSAFDARSPLRISGDEWLCDHLHPNPDGYYLMAQCYAALIRSGRFLQNVNEAFTPPERAPFVTDLDWNIGLMRVFKLKQRWPFADKEVDYADYRPWGEPRAAKAAYDYLFSHNNWVKAHYAMADFYLQSGRTDQARREYEAIVAYYPNRAEPLVKIAATYETDQNWSAAEHYYLSALPLSDNKGLIYYQVALNQWKQRKMAQAIEHMQRAIVAPELTAEQGLVARYYLAGFYIDVNRLDFARQVLQDIFSINARFQPALELWQKYFEK